MKQIEANFADWCKQAYQCACNHGFHDKTFSDEHWMMMAVIEVGEMVEADREGRFADKRSFEASDTVNDEDFKDKFKRFIKDFMEDEMPDVVLILSNFSAMKGFHLDENMNHIVHINAFTDSDGDFCKSVSELGFRITHLLTSCNSISRPPRIAAVIGTLLGVADERGIDLAWHVKQKMRYNSLRPKLNGKRY